jgi:hypothetical protein
MADTDDNILMRGHKYLKKNYPLGYEAAQLVTPIGIAAAAMEGADALKHGDAEELGKAALSAFPVSKAYRVGNKVAKALKEVTGAGSTAQKGLNVARKAAAGENVAEAGEAGFAEGRRARENFAKGGAVRGWGKARNARGAKYL